MDFIRTSIEKPVTVLVGILLIVLFGVIGLIRMPFQLTPDVSEPEITVTTVWPGATPYEIERQIVEEQEDVLKGLPGLVEMESSSFNSRGNISLRFRVGTDLDDALLRVSNKMNEVTSYPENVEKPVISATGAATSPVIWMILRTSPENANSIQTYRTYFEHEVRQYLERVPGVADLFIGGGTEKQMHIVLKPDKLAAYGLSIDKIINLLRAENIDISAGGMEVGRRDYRIRTMAELRSAEDISNLIIQSDGQRRIRMADIADVHVGYEKRTVAMLHNATEGIAVGIKPEPGTNIIDMTNRVEEVVKELNKGKLKSELIFLDWVYDQRPYIEGAINLVKDDILMGGVLAVVVLMVFLGSISSTLIISTAIPISIIGTFIFMYALGRTLNVISLAGISFSVGILVDNAIVVLENIDRHRKMGKSAFDAAYDGASEVWGAILNTTVSTVAVFLPVVFVKEEAGQLFGDIAIAACSSVAISLFVSVSVIPMLSYRIYSVSNAPMTVRDNILTRIGHGMSDIIMSMVSLCVNNRLISLFTVLAMTCLSLLIGYSLYPKMEYLPQGNRNLVINILIPPPGLSYEERLGIGKKLFADIDPYFKKEKDGIPGIKNMFYVGTESFMLSGAISTHEQRAGELVPVFMKSLNTLPGVFGISSQAGIFQTSLGRGRAIEIDISGNDINRVTQAAGMMFGMIKKELPDAQVRPVPSIELLYPEINILPDRDRLRSAGLSAREFGLSLDVMMDGRKVGEFNKEGEPKSDLILRMKEEESLSPEEVFNQSIAVPQGKLLPISSLSDIVNTYGLTEIRHLERRRTVTLQVTPSLEMAVEEAMQIISGKVIPAVRQQGMLDGLDARQGGVADKIDETRKVLQWNFILAAVIMYLIMAALFENFLYPLIIMITVPLGAAGGFIGLKLVNLLSATPQPFDILTMLGFIISVGIVVDNATLIVYQAITNARNGMGKKDAILDATRTRLRPVYMSTATTVFGMLPLVMAPGPGSELYRGLGSVMLGGIVFSTLFTVFVIPAMLLIFLAEKKR